MKVTHIEIDGLAIELIQKAVKHIHLRVYPPDGRICVSVPQHISMSEAYHQIAIKRQWLVKQRQKILAQAVHNNPVIDGGQLHLFLGKFYPLQIIDDSFIPRGVSCNETALIINVPSSYNMEQKRLILEKWYRQQMQQRLPDLLDKWQSIIGVQISAWGIKKMKTRWGSCNIKARRIWLNLGLIQKPIPCLESVIAHELIHLLEPSHNARFYQLMDHFYPEWRTYQSWLKT